MSVAGLDTTSVALGRTFGLAIASEIYGDTWKSLPTPGRLFSWGDNYVGQLGSGGYASYKSPTLVRSCCRSVLTPQGTIVCDKTIDEETLVAVRAGSFHSFAITDKGVLYAWGWNIFGQLGVGILSTNPTVPSPLAVESLESAGQFVVDAAGGYSHSLVLTKSGDIYAMGANENGQLGTGDKMKSRVPLRVVVPGPTGEPRRFKQVAAGLFHSLAVTTDGVIFAWGSNAFGQLGLCASIPRSSGEAGVCFVSAGEGSGFFDQLVPVQVKELASVRIASVSAGARHSTAVSEGGDVYVWGDNSDRQLGVPLALDDAGNAVLVHVTPQLVRSFYTPATACSHPHRDVGRPAESDVALTAGGQEIIRCFSDEEIGRYGALAAMSAAGDSHTIVVVRQRRRLAQPFAPMTVPRLYTLGKNDDGQLGLGDTSPRLTPQLYLGLSASPAYDIVAVQAAFDQTSLVRACPANEGVPCSSKGLCYRDGACYCLEGVRGRDCAFECLGGKDKPCSGNGDESKARSVARRLQQALVQLAGWELRVSLVPSLCLCLSVPPSLPLCVRVHVTLSHCLCLRLSLYISLCPLSPGSAFPTLLLFQFSLFTHTASLPILSLYTLDASMHSK